MTRKKSGPNGQDLAALLAEAHARLAEAEQALEAMRTGSNGPPPISTAAAPEVYSRAGENTPEVYSRAGENTPEGNGGAGELEAARERLRHELAERLRMEQALRASEERYRILLERLRAVLSATGVGLWLLDLPSGPLIWDDRTRELFFLPPGVDPTTEYYWSRLHPEDREPARRAFESAMRDRTLFSMDLRIVDPDTGRVRWIHSESRATYDDHGQAVRFDGINYEISDRRQSEEAVRQSERLYRAIGESIDYGIWICDPQGRNTYASESFLALLGITQEQCSDLGWADLLHPDDIDATVAAWKECVKGGGPWYREHRYRGADGEWHPMLACGVAVRDEHGRILHWAGINLDISRLKQVEEDLKQARDRLRLAVEGSAGAEWEIPADPSSPDGLSERMTSSPLLKSFIGFSEAELPDSLSAWNERVHPEDLPRLRSSARDHMQGRQPHHRVDYRIRHKDGSWRWIASTGRLFRDPDGRPVRWAGVDWDITVQKETEQALRASEEKLRSVLENMSEGLMLFDPRGNLIYQNPASLRIHGFERLEEGLIAHEDLPATWDVWDESGRRIGFDEWPVSRVFRNERFQDQVLRVVRAETGHEFYGSYNGSPIPDAEGNLVLGFVTIRDITERVRAQKALQESERRFRVLADGTPVLIWVHDAEGGLHFVNRAYREFFGLTIEQVEGGKWQPLVHPEDAPGYIGRFNESNQSRRPFQAEARVRRHDGMWRWIESVAVPRFSAAGEYMGMAGSTVDITERKEAEAILAGSREELERLVAERTAKLHDLVGELEHFSYTITHDMRAPLRAMRGFAEAADELCGAGSAGGGSAGDGSGAAGSVAEQKMFLGRIISAAERLDGLITDSLNYSRAIRDELPLAPVDLGRLLRGILDSYPNLQSDKAEVILEGGIPPVMGNEAALTQCYSNLLGNAVKFGRPGIRPEVRVRAEMSEGWVRVWVEDNGIGISPALLPRVFDMFSRGNNPHSGTGIGLALVRKVVHRMGGRLGVESEPGKGSRFWIELRPGDLRRGA